MVITAHNLNQGEGRATILPWFQHAELADREKQRKHALDYQQRQYDLADKARRQKAAEDAQTDFENGQNKAWYLHDAELQSLQGEILQEATKLGANGVVNPWGDASPQSQAFREKKDKAIDMARYSGQMKADWEELQKIYNNPANQGKIKNWPEIFDYYHNNSLSDIVGNRMKPPELKFTQPVSDLQKVVQNSLDALSGKQRDKEFTETEAVQQATMALAGDPLLGGTIDQMMSGPMLESDSKRYQAMTEGKDPSIGRVLVLADMIKNGHRPPTMDWGKEMTEAVSAAKGALEKSEYGGFNPDFKFEGFSVKTGKSEKAAKAQFDALMAGKPWILEDPSLYQFLGVAPKADVPIADKAAMLRDAWTKKTMSQVPVDSRYKKTPMTGDGGAEKTNEGDRWYRDLSGSDPVAVESAESQARGVSAFDQKDAVVESFKRVKIDEVFPVSGDGAKARRDEVYGGAKEGIQIQFKKDMTIAQKQALTEEIKEKNGFIDTQIKSEDDKDKKAKLEAQKLKFDESAGTIFVPLNEENKPFLMKFYGKSKKETGEKYQGVELPDFNEPMTTSTPASNSAGKPKPKF